MRQKKRTTLPALMPTFSCLKMMMNTGVRVSHCLFLLRVRTRNAATPAACVLVVVLFVEVPASERLQGDEPTEGLATKHSMTQIVDGAY